MDIKSLLAFNASIYSGRVYVDPCPPVLPIPALLLLAVKVAVKSYLHPKG